MQVKYPIAFLTVFIGAQSLAGSFVTGCEEAIKDKQPSQVLQLCQAPAEQGDIQATTALAEAMLSQKTAFFDAINARMQGKELTLKLGIEEKIFLYDAKEYLKTAAQGADAKAQYLLAMMELQTITNGGILPGEHAELLDIEALELSAHSLLKSSANAGNLDAIKYLASDGGIFDCSNS